MSPGCCPGDVHGVAIRQLTGVLLGLQLVLQFDALPGDVLRPDFGTVLQGQFDTLLTVYQVACLAWFCSM